MVRLLRTDNSTSNWFASRTYTVTITDFNNCTTTASITVGQPPVLTASISSVDVLCKFNFTGSATVNPSGGTYPYDYLWNTTDGDTTRTINNIPADFYSVIVTDAHKCVITYTITVNEPDSVLTAAATENDVICYGGNNGNASANAKGGTRPYTYLWSDAQTTVTANDLIAGNYTVTVTDHHSCTTIVDSITITQPDSALVITSLTKTDALCNGGLGIATVTAIGGTRLLVNNSYNYLWSLPAARQLQLQPV